MIDDPRSLQRGGDSSSRRGAADVHILWISEGMSCDGDTVSITAATLPALEEVLLGLIPGLPRVHLHNKVLARETGDEFLAWFWKAKRGELDPFVFVFEGSVPNERINGDGFWSSFGYDHETKQPITPTAASTPWPAIRPGAWGSPTTSDGASAPPVACRS
jgi:hydrogenase small subunit